MSRPLTESCIKKCRIHNGKSVDFYCDRVRLPNGRSALREYTAHPGAVAVLPFVDPDTIILVRQYRYPVGRITYELPAGKLSPRENPLSCARRELREETGFTARRFKKLFAFWPTAAFSNEVLHVYRADRLKAGPAAPDDDEFVEAVRVPFRKALDWVYSGKIKDAKTIIGLLAAAPSPVRHR